LVCIGNLHSTSSNLHCGVPLGSILAPILFYSCMCPLGNRKYNIMYHWNTDDTQLYSPIDPKGFGFR